MGGLVEMSLDEVLPLEAALEHLQGFFGVWTRRLAQVELGEAAMPFAIRIDHSPYV